MKNEITIDRKAFDKALEGFERDTGLSAHDVLVDSMRTLLRGIVRAMPPKTQGVGRTVIRNDLSRVLGSFDNQPTLKAMDKMFGRRFSPVHFDPVGGAEAEAHVERFRNARGRITAKARLMKVGPYEFAGKRHVSKREHNRILRAKQAKVGMAKAGFLAAARMFGVSLPGWISRHANAPGSGRDTWSKRTTAWYLEAANHVPHAQRHRGLVEVNLQKITRAVVSNMDRQLIRIANKHSAK
jgi:hypothetical protein